MGFKIIYIDVESTGTQVYKHDIVQLSGFIEIDGKEVDSFDWYMQPFNYNTISPKALEINNLTIEKLRTFEKPQKVFMRFLHKISKYINVKDNKDKYILAGQNVSFDRDMLKLCFTKAGYQWEFGNYFDYRVLDLCALNMLLINAGLLKTDTIKLEVISELYDVPIEKAHNSWYDITTTRKIMRIIESAFLKTPTEVDISSLVKDSPIYQHIDHLQKEAHRKETKEREKGRST